MTCFQTELQLTPSHSHEEPKFVILCVCCPRTQCLFYPGLQFATAKVNIYAVQINTSNQILFIHFYYWKCSNIKCNYCRYNAEEYARKFGSAPVDNISNNIDDVDNKLSPAAKEDGGLTSTIIELAVKFVPTLINIISGETGPSQTDRIEGIDLNVGLQSFIHQLSSFIIFL